jgi:hypothetical protein
MRLAAPFFLRLFVAAACAAILSRPAAAQIKWLAPYGPNGEWVLYERNGTAQTWQAARTSANAASITTGYPIFAASINGRLVTVNSGAENQYLTQFLGTGWIGLNDVALEFGNTSGLTTPVNAVPVAGQRGAGYVWDSGQPFLVSRWNGGEPNDAGGEDAIEIVGGGAWNDIPDNNGGFTRPSTIEFHTGKTQLSQVATPGFLVKVVQASNGAMNDFGAGNLLNLAQVDSLIASQTAPGTVFGGPTPVSMLDFMDDVSGGGGGFGVNNIFPGHANGVDDNDKALLVTGTLNVAAAGNYTFAHRGDDGGRIRIDGMDVVYDSTFHGDTTVTSASVNLTAGAHTLEYVAFEGGGGWFAEATYDNLGLGGGPVLIGDATQGISLSGAIARSLSAVSAGATDSFADANALLTGATQADNGTPVMGVARTINMLDGGGDGHFGGNDSFLGVSGDNYALRATGFIEVPAGQGGTWTFGTSGDDGVRLLIDGSTVINDDPGLHPPTDNFGTISLTPGFHQLEFTFWEAGGGAEVELFAAFGSFGAFGPQFDLVGDTANGGLAVFTNLELPEPASVALWAIVLASAVGFAWRRRVVHAH